MNEKAQRIFEQICDLSQERRIREIDQLCAGDSIVREEVESLLRAHDDAGQFLNEPTIDSHGAVAPAESGGGPASGSTAVTERPGTIIDRYKLLENIGEGGFGVVYMAQQSEPIRRRVALKIIKLGMDTKQVVARFEAERQALAVMDHPNIARVIDGGSTETGRPYFVMELVRGDPITTYCDQKRLPLRQRLELFQQVCRAVEHAHQKGIIHRDIKPSNVLVTIADDQPLVKVIDFGIAKATSTDLTDKTLFTEFRQLIGTPLYMSPEQAERSGVDVDTRTDVYALGVMLYEMLTGRTPLDPKQLNSAAWDEFQRLIVEEEPSKPSVMVTSTVGELAEIAKLRGTEPARLGALLRGDLDWIVLKAIEKDRSRRYSTASEFASDIDRFLSDQPVEATPPSKSYQLRKFARCNRILLSTAAAVFAALVIGLVATSATAAWAVRERHAADGARAEAERQERSARRAATIAGASVMLAETDADNLAEGWKTEIAELREASGGNTAEVVKLETQYTTWHATWLFQHGRPAEAAKLIDGCYGQAREFVGTGDAVFLALCNVRILALQSIDSDPNTSAESFADLMEALENVQGKGTSLGLLPQYAGALAEAGRKEKAAAVIRDYLKYRDEQTSPPSASDNLRLEMSMDPLVKWGEDYPELLQKLQAIRETGAATSQQATTEDDKELANDLEMLQGRWEQRRVENSVFIDHMTQDFVGKLFTTQFLDEDGSVLRGRSGRLELSRSGGTKVLTVYGAGTQIGIHFIYHIRPNQFTIVSGLLSNRASLPDIEMRKFLKVSDAKQ